MEEFSKSGREVRKYSYIRSTIINIKSVQFKILLQQNKKITYGEIHRKRFERIHIMSIMLFTSGKGKAGLGK